MDSTKTKEREREREREKRERERERESQGRGRQQDWLTDDGRRSLRVLLCKPWSLRSGSPCM